MPSASSLSRGVPLALGSGVSLELSSLQRGPALSLQAGPRAGHPGTAPTGPPSEPALPAPRPGCAEGCRQGRGLRGRRGAACSSRVELGTDVDVLVTCICFAAGLKGRPRGTESATCPWGPEPQAGDPGAAQRSPRPQAPVGDRPSSSS